LSWSQYPAKPVGVGTGTSCIPGGQNSRGGRGQEVAGMFLFRDNACLSGGGCKLLRCRSRIGPWLLCCCACVSCWLLCCCKKSSSLIDFSRSKLPKVLSASNQLSELHARSFGVPEDSWCGSRQVLLQDLVSCCSAGSPSSTPTTQSTLCCEEWRLGMNSSSKDHGTVCLFLPKQAPKHEDSFDRFSCLALAALVWTVTKGLGKCELARVVATSFDASRAC